MLWPSVVSVNKSFFFFFLTWMIPPPPPSLPSSHSWLCFAKLALSHQGSCETVVLISSGRAFTLRHAVCATTAVLLSGISRLDLRPPKFPPPGVALFGGLPPHRLHGHPNPHKRSKSNHSGMIGSRGSRRLKQIRRLFRWYFRSKWLTDGKGLETVEVLSWLMRLIIISQTFGLCGPSCIKLKRPLPPGTLLWWAAGAVLMETNDENRVSVWQMDRGLLKPRAFARIGHTCWF